MINYIAHFYAKGVSLIWTFKLPYRLIKGDEIHEEFLIYQSKLQNKHQIPNEYYNLTIDEYLIIDRIYVDNTGILNVWLEIPKHDN